MSIIYYNPDDYISESGSRRCLFHQENPGTNFAGCTCSSWYFQRKKTNADRRAEKTSS